MVHGVGVAVAAGFGLHQSSMGSGGSSGKETACNAGDLVRFLGQEGPWRREWLPTPVFLPGASHRQRSLVATAHGVMTSWT